LTIFLNYLKTRQLKKSIPIHFFPATIGVIFFALGGIGDLIWHTFFGFEKSIEALISPTHLLLFLGLFLIFLSPLNYVLFESKGKSWRFYLVFVISVSVFFSYFTFLTEYVNPLISPFAFKTHQTNNHYYGQAIGMASIFIHNIFFVGTIIYVLIYKKFLPGILFLITIINTLAMTTVHDHYDFILSAFISGIFIELVYFWVKPSFKNLYRLQFFCISVPLIYTLFYFIVGMVTRGIWWTPHLWLGTILMTGFFGWLLCRLVISGRYPKK
jgi:hypothetical protein